MSANPSWPQYIQWDKDGNWFVSLGHAGYQGPEGAPEIRQTEHSHLPRFKAVVGFGPKEGSKLSAKLYYLSPYYRRLHGDAAAHNAASKVSDSANLPDDFFKPETIDIIDVRQGSTGVHDDFLPDNIMRHGFAYLQLATQHGPLETALNGVARLLPKEMAHMHKSIQQAVAKVESVATKMMREGALLDWTKVCPGMKVVHVMPLPGESFSRQSRYDNGFPVAHSDTRPMGALFKMAQILKDAKRTRPHHRLLVVNIWVPLGYPAWQECLAMMDWRLADTAMSIPAKKESVPYYLDSHCAHGPAFYSMRHQAPNEMTIHIQYDSWRPASLGTIHAAAHVQNPEQRHEEQPRQSFESRFIVALEVDHEIRPADSAWTRHADTRGRVFYANDQTQTTAWMPNDGRFLQKGLTHAPPAHRGIEPPVWEAKDHDGRPWPTQDEAPQAPAPFRFT